jgi:two-component system nitrogen regulation sensor histidine kinase NtrY
LSAQKKAAWSDIAQRIAHEIRNPLTPLQLSVEKIYKNFKPKDPNELRSFNNYLETIQRQVDDIGKLVGEFSSFARMPSVNLYYGDLDKVISTQLSLFQISNSNIIWSYKNELPNEFKLLIDSQQIRQGLTNIFQNSIDSINENSKISQGIINIYTKLKNEKVLLVIEDNGSGFPEDRENLTNPYITFREKGTGLGLSIVKRIVDEHNGKLLLSDSKLGGAKTMIEFLI